MQAVTTASLRFTDRQASVHGLHRTDLQALQLLVAARASGAGPLSPGRLATELEMSPSAVTTLVQQRAKPAMQGRVFGLIGTMYSGFLLIGMSVFGPLADLVSLPLLMILTGALLSIVAVFYWLDMSFGKPPSTDE